nr:hypothetical protein [Tanacetum cinerariifolium]
GLSSTGVDNTAKTRQLRPKSNTKNDRVPSASKSSCINVSIKILSQTRKKCILSGPYKPTTILVQAIAATDDSLEIPEHMIVETPMNTSPENKAHFQAEKEAIHMILIGIGDGIYSTIDACQIAHETYKGKEIAKPITPPSEIAFEDDSFPEQAQRDKDMQKNLTLIGKPNGDALRKCILSGPYKPTTVVVQAVATTDDSPVIPENTIVETPMNMSPINKAHFKSEKGGKKIAKPITPPSESASEEDIDPEQAQMDKDMQKNLALIAKYFKKIYKPTNNNLGTSSNSRNKNVDTNSRYKNDN